MAKLSNARHEAFAQYLSEGKSQGEAYALAYDRNHDTYTNRAASELVTKCNIRERISELQERRQRQGDVTVDSITEMLRKDHKAAHSEGQIGAAVSASMGLAKLHGLITDKVKSESVIKHDPDDLTDDELAAIAVRGRSVATEEAESPPDASRLH